MDINDYEKIEEKIERAIATAFKSILPDILKPLEKRVETVELTQAQCPARKSAMGIQSIVARGLNLLIIGGLVYLARLIMRPEVWEFLRTVASID